jgi:hypothetical protein
VGRNVHKDKPRTLWAAGKREPAAAKQEAMYFLREEKSREVKGGRGFPSGRLSTHLAD